MAENASNAPVVFLKKIKKRQASHHGGMWKVAYADFVTAMMAFFLLLWLLNATSEEQKRGIADYFSPFPGTIRSTAGGESFMDGDTITAEGTMVEDETPPGITVSPSAVAEAPETARQSDPNQDENLDRLLARREEEKFAEAEFALRQAIRDIPELKELAKSLIIDRTPEGLRIQIVDQEGLSMFPLGSSDMYERTRKLLEQVAKVVQKLPNKISITGHTDARPYHGTSGYGNWELSTDRANASRRALVEAGLPLHRILKVVGKAAREPLIPRDPTSPRNRRISIVLLREQPPPKEQEAEAKPSTPPASPAPSEPASRAAAETPLASAEPAPASHDAAPPEPTPDGEAAVSPPPTIGPDPGHWKPVEVR